METLDELELYIRLLESQKNKKYTDHEELIRDLKYEFNITASLQQISAIYSPSAEDMEVDLKIIYNNLG